VGCAKRIRAIGVDSHTAATTHLEGVWTSVEVEGLDDGG
jgi:hypothetical protein